MASRSKQRPGTWCSAVRHEKAERHNRQPLCSIERVVQRFRKQIARIPHTHIPGVEAGRRRLLLEHAPLFCQRNVAPNVSGRSSDKAPFIFLDSPKFVRGTCRRCHHAAFSSPCPSVGNGMSKHPGANRSSNYEMKAIVETRVFGGSAEGGPQLALTRSDSSWTADGVSVLV